MLKIKDIELKLQLEKMVIGLEEPILIKGGGKFIAKVDSGNGGYNVIHGEDFVKQGDILNFKTYDADGNERRISKKISDVVNINIGGGNIQERPVVELDIKFADEEYRKIPFSVTDRSSNSQKVLLSKDFVKNELQALIDVGKTNMTENEPVEVEYVTEAKNNRSGSLKRIVKHPINSLRSGIDKTSAFMKKMAYGGSSPINSYNEIDVFDGNKNKSTGNAEVDKKIAELSKVIKDDEQLILIRIKQEMPQIAQAVSANKNPNNKQGINFNVVRILDYTNHGISGPAFEVENSLIYKNLNDLAAEKVKNTQSDASSKEQNFNNSNDIKPASQSNAFESSYFDKWMTRYEYLTEGKAKPVRIFSKNGEEIIGATISNNKLYLPKRKGGEQDITLDKKISKGDLTQEELEKIAQAAYDKKYNPSKITKPKEENTTPSDGQPQETSKPETDPPASGQPAPSPEQAKPENDEEFKRKLAELNKKLQDEISNKNQFCFYFCGNIPKDSIMQMFNSVNEPYSNKSISFLNNMKFNEGTFNAYALQLTQDLKNTNAYNNGCCGLYALCVGNIGSRTVKLFYDQNVVLPLKK